MELFYDGIGNKSKSNLKNVCLILSKCSLVKQSTIDLISIKLTDLSFKEKFPTETET